MYNWSTDEKSRSQYPLSVRKIVSFLEINSKVKTIGVFRNKSIKNRLIIRPKYTLRVKLDPSIKPAEKTTLAFTLREMIGDSAISVVEKK